MLSKLFGTPDLTLGKPVEKKPIIVPIMTIIQEENHVNIGLRFTNLIS